MRWVKKGLIFVLDGRREWSVAHTQIPTPHPLTDGEIRVYYGTRNRDNQTSTGWFDVEAGQPERVLRVGDHPVLSPGRLGTFDDCGAMPSCVVTVRGRVYLYYVGWNRRNSVPYQNSIGVAISDNGGDSFIKLSEGPVMDRSTLDPYFVTTPFVAVEGGVWRMWYSTCTEWVEVDGSPEPRYRVAYAESVDGIHWERMGTVCVSYLTDDEAIARAWVVMAENRYRMWYCFRSIWGYRSDPSRGYRLGYAESSDGLTWERFDRDAGLERSTTGWDSEMVAYPAVYQHNGRWLMLYNGNGFGKSGIGYAELDQN